MLTLVSSFHEKKNEMMLETHNVSVGLSDFLHCLFLHFVDVCLWVRVCVRVHSGLRCFPHTLPLCPFPYFSLTP